MSRVTQREIIEKLSELACLGNGITHGNSIGNQIAIDLMREIEANGIEVAYVLMTDDELHRIWIAAEALNATETMRLLENRVLARLGVVPVIKKHDDCNYKVVLLKDKP